MNDLMRKIRLGVLVLLFVVSSHWLSCALQAANEINAFAPGVTTAYAVVREVDGDFWYPVGQAFEVYGTGGRAMADYDIALTDKSGDMFVGNFDANIGAGTYHVVTHYQAGGAPSETDPVVWAEYGQWDGASWSVSFAPSAGTIAAAVWTHDISAYSGAGQAGTYLDTLYDDWTNGGRLDLLVDAIKAMTDLIVVVTTTVSDANDANEFTLTAGLDVNDAFTYNVIQVQDATDGHREVRYIEEWLSTREVLVDEPFGFTPEVGDNVWIMGTSFGGYLYDILHRVNLSSVPLYHFDNTTGGSGGTSGQGGVTIFGADGSDP